MDNLFSTESYRINAHPRFWWWKDDVVEGDPLPYHLMDENERELFQKWYDDTEQKRYTGECSIPFVSQLIGFIGGNNIRKVVQLGHYAGYSTIILGIALKKITKGRLVSIDIDSTVCKYTQEWVDRFELSDTIKILQGDSASLVACREAGGYFLEDGMSDGVPEVIIIDSAHTYEHTIRELDAWMPLLKNNGFIFLHDASIYAQEFDSTKKGGVLAAVKFWCDKNQYDCFTFNGNIVPGTALRDVVYKDGCGLCVIQKKQNAPIVALEQGESTHNRAELYCPLCSEKYEFKALPPVKLPGGGVTQLAECLSCGSILNVDAIKSIGETDIVSLQGGYIERSHGSVNIDGPDVRKNITALNGVHEFLFKICPKLNRGSMLDFGCGHGYMSAAGTVFFDRVYAVDFNMEMIRNLLPHFSDHTRIFPMDSLDDLPEPVDAIYAWHVFEHLPDIAGTILSLQKHLKENGIIFFQVPMFLVEKSRLVNCHYTFLVKKSVAILARKTGMEFMGTWVDEANAYLSGILRLTGKKVKAPNCDHETKPEINGRETEYTRNAPLLPSIREQARFHRVMETLAPIMHGRMQREIPFGGDILQLYEPAARFFAATTSALDDRQFEGILGKYVERSAKVDPLDSSGNLRRELDTAELEMEEYVKYFYRNKQCLHLELGTWNKYPDNVKADIVQDMGYSDLVRLDFSDEYDVDVVGDVAYLPFKDASFNTVKAVSVFEHTAFPDRQIKEAFRVLGPGGCLMLEMPALFTYHGVPFDYIRLMPDYFRDVCSKIGFSKVHVFFRNYGGFFNVAHQMLRATSVNEFTRDKRLIDTLTILQHNFFALTSMSVFFDDYFHDWGSNLFTYIVCYAFKDGGMDVQNRLDVSADNMLDRMCPILASPATGHGLSRAGDFLVSESGENFSVRNGIPYLIDPGQSFMPPVMKL
jgi:ubiquinone/menaquinone biosynthesis C-methylase UbiE/predicted O-methyltransferase YrrM